MANPRTLVDQVIQRTGRTLADANHEIRSLAELMLIQYRQIDAAAEQLALALNRNRG